MLSETCPHVFPHHEGWIVETCRILGEAGYFCVCSFGLLGKLFSSVHFSRSVVSDSLWPHEPQHARPPCPSQTPGLYSNSCQLSRWCHPAILSSVVPFSSCPYSLPASGSFPVSQLFSWGGQRIACMENSMERGAWWLYDFHCFQQQIHLLILTFLVEYLGFSTYKANQQIWKTQQLPQDWKMSIFIPIPKKGNAKECSNFYRVALIEHASKVMLKILQARLQQYVNQDLPDEQARFSKGRTRDQIANICWIIEKAREFQKKQLLLHHWLC